MERNAEAPGDDYSREKMVGGSHLQIYKNLLQKIKG